MCQPTPAPKLYPDLLLPEQVSEPPLPHDFNLTLSSEAGISIAPLSSAPERAARRAPTSNLADSLPLPAPPDDSFKSARSAGSAAGFAPIPAHPQGVLAACPFDAMQPEKVVGGGLDGWDAGSSVAVLKERRNSRGSRGSRGSWSLRRSRSSEAHSHSCLPLFQPPPSPTRPSLGQGPSAVGPPSPTSAAAVVPVAAATTSALATAAPCSACLSKRLARQPLCTPAAPWPPFATAAGR